MSVLKLAITTARPNSFCTELQVAQSKHSVVQKILNYLTGIVAGNEKTPSINLQVEGSMAAASGSFALNTVIATDAVSINGVTFTAVSSGATGNQFNVGVSDAATATNLANAINNSTTALVDGYVIAASVDTDVIIASAFYGIAGNMTTIASADATIVASGARLEGGTDDASAVTLSF